MSLFHVGYTMRDDDGDTSTLGIKVPRGSLTLAQIEGFATGFAAILDDCLDVVIDEIRIVLDVALPGGLRTTPVINCEVQKGALLSYSANGTSYRHSIRIPGFRAAKFSGNSVNVGDTDFVALNNALLSGVDVSGTMVQPSDKYENDLDSLISAVKSFRRK